MIIRPRGSRGEEFLNFSHFRSLLTLAHFFRTHLKNVDQGSGQGANRFESRCFEHTRKYVSILNRVATPPWTLRRVFEMSSSLLDFVWERV